MSKIGPSTTLRIKAVEVLNQRFGGPWFKFKGKNIKQMYFFPIFIKLIVIGYPSVKGIVFNQLWDDSTKFKITYQINE